VPMMAVAVAMSSSVAWCPFAIALIPIPMAQGVFGITLITLALGPRCSEILLESMPAMMLMTMDGVASAPSSVVAASND